MKKSALLFLSFLYLTHFVNGQSAEKLANKLQDTYNGTIVLKSGDVIEGDFVYNPLTVEGLLQFSYKGNNYTAGPGKVSSFGFYDEATSRYRKFQSFPVYNELTDATHEIFMEILHETAYISLVGRKTTDISNSHPFNNGSRASNVKVIKGYERYFIDMNTARMYEMTKKELLKLTEDKKPEVKTFIKDEKIALTTSAGYIKVIDYYASLK